MTIVPLPIVSFQQNLTEFISRTGTRLEMNRITQHPRLNEDASALAFLVEAGRVKPYRTEIISPQRQIAAGFDPCSQLASRTHLT
jgi:hypothetical protein